MMGGPIAAYVSPGHDGKLYVSALLPLVLFLLVRGMRDGKRWSWGALALTVGLAVLSPHPQLLQYLLLCAGAFALYLAFAGAGREPLPRGDRGHAPRARRRCRRARLRHRRRAVPAGAWSTSPGRRAPAGCAATRRRRPISFPPEELLNTYLPQFSGILDNYWGRNGIHFHSEYLGAVVLLLAGLGLATAAGAEKGRSFTGSGSARAIVALLWSLGGFTPFYQLVYAIVPGTKFFRAPSTMMFVMAFAVAVLAALGAERVAAGKVTQRYAIGWLVGAGAILLLGVDRSADERGAGGRDAGARRRRARQRAADRASARSARSWRSRSRRGCSSRCSRGVLKPLTAAYALAALVMVDLWSVEQLYWRFSEPASVLFARDAITDYLGKQEQPARVLAIATAAGRRPTTIRSSAGDGLMPHRIRSVARLPWQ